MSFAPGASVDRLFIRDGVHHWVQGYRVYDPQEEFASIKGVTTAKLKKKPRQGYIHIVANGQYKAMRVPLAEVRLHDPATAVTFASVFGSFGSAVVQLTGVEKAETEDLAIGLDPIPTDFDEEEF